MVPPRAPNFAYKNIALDILTYRLCVGMPMYISATKLLNVIKPAFFNPQIFSSNHSYLRKWGMTRILVKFFASLV